MCQQPITIPILHCCCSSHFSFLVCCSAFRFPTRLFPRPDSSLKKKKKKKGWAYACVYAFGLWGCCCRHIIGESHDCICAVHSNGDNEACWLLLLLWCEEPITSPVVLVAHSSFLGEFTVRTTKKASNVCTIHTPSST